MCASCGAAALITQDLGDSGFVEDGDDAGELIGLFLLLEKGAADVRKLRKRQEARLAARNRFAALAAEAAGDDPPAPLTVDDLWREAAARRDAQEAALAAGDLTRALSSVSVVDMATMTQAQAFAWHSLDDAGRELLCGDRERRGTLNRRARALLPEAVRVAIDNARRGWLNAERDSAGSGDESD